MLWTEPTASLLAGTRQLPAVPCRNTACKVIHGQFQAGLWPTNSERFEDQSSSQYFWAAFYTVSFQGVFSLMSVPVRWHSITAASAYKLPGKTLFFHCRFGCYFTLSFVISTCIARVCTAAMHSCSHLLWQIVRTGRSSAFPVCYMPPSFR